MNTFLHCRRKLQVKTFSSEKWICGCHVTTFHAHLLSSSLAESLPAKFSVAGIKLKISFSLSAVLTTTWQASFGFSYVEQCNIIRKCSTCALVKQALSFLKCQSGESLSNFVLVSSLNHQLYHEQDFVPRVWLLLIRWMYYELLSGYRTKVNEIAIAC